MTAPSAICAGLIAALAAVPRPNTNIAARNPILVTVIFDAPVETNRPPYGLACGKIVTVAHLAPVGPMASDAHAQGRNAPGTGGKITAVGHAQLADFW
jgi:hypothetical protein